jgi:hypothetical protein
MLREALKLNSWLLGDANDARVLKGYADGRKRIAAATERKLPPMNH